MIRFALIAAVSLSATAAVAGPSVTPNAAAITVVTPVPLAPAEAPTVAQAPVQRVVPAQPLPAQSAFIAGYVHSFSR